jgi:hypothetical protein
MLREEHKLSVFENRKLRKTFETKKDGVIGKWRRLHKEEIYDRYASPTVIWEIKYKNSEMGRACNTKVSQGFGGIDREGID